MPEVIWHLMGVARLLPGATQGAQERRVESSRVEKMGDGPVEGVEGGQRIGRCSAQRQDPGLE